ncbi:MAG: hypothetical protein V1888_01050, partial [archaeon]
IKRKYGNFILSKSFESQKKELIFRLIAYNVDRKLILSVWVLGFHQSLKRKDIRIVEKTVFYEKSVYCWD